MVIIWWGKQKMQRGRKLKTAVHQKCECQELFPLPQHLFLFCQPTDRGLSHSIYSVITLLCQEYSEGGYWKWVFSITKCYCRAASVRRNLYVRKQQKRKGRGVGFKWDFFVFSCKTLSQFEYHLSLAYICNNFNRMVFISKTSRGFEIFCEPLLLCRIFHSCKNLAIKIPFNITDVRVI